MFTIAKPTAGSSGSTSTSSRRSARATRFDAGLINPDGKKRPGYRVVQKRKARALPQVRAFPEPFRDEGRLRAAFGVPDWRAVPTFCRHGRLQANCPICSKKGGVAGRARGAARPPCAARAAPPPGVAARRAAWGGDLKVRRLARAADDGYENELVPGLRASADAGAGSPTSSRSPVARLAELAHRPARALRRGRRGGRPRGGRSGSRS